MTVTITIKGTDETRSAFTGVIDGLDDIGKAANQANGQTTGFFSGMLQSAAGFLAANVIGSITASIGDAVGSIFSFASDSRQAIADLQAQLGITRQEAEQWGGLAQEIFVNNWGDSIGCWEGDTLTIDTVGVKYDPEFNFVAPPLSGNAHFVERIRMTGPDRLESEITITDPEYLERPWQVHMVYLRHPVLTRLVHESDIFANDRTQPGEGIVADAGPRAVLDPSYLPEKEPELTAEQLDRVAGRYAFNEQPLELVVERRGNRVVFKAPPALNFFLPLYARDPLNFVAVDGGTFRFLTDDRGRVIGFEGTNPAGMPMTGRRISP